jgi:hypothetical protein
MTKQDLKENTKEYPAPLPYTAPDGRRYKVYTHLHPQLKDMIGTWGFFYNHNIQSVVVVGTFSYMKLLGIDEDGYPKCEAGITSFFAVPIIAHEKTAKIVITENDKTREVELTQEQIEQLGI